MIILLQEVLQTISEGFKDNPNPAALIFKYLLTISPEKANKYAMQLYKDLEVNGKPVFTYGLDGLRERIIIWINRFGSCINRVSKKFDRVPRPSTDKYIKNLQDSVDCFKKSLNNFKPSVKPTLPKPIQT